MMRQYLLFTAFFCGMLGHNFLAKSQSSTPVKKIRVILLGTFHFGETTDRNKTSFPDLFSPTRQQQLDQLANKLAAQNPDKIFIEAAPKRQVRIGSLYENIAIIN